MLYAAIEIITLNIISYAHPRPTGVYGNMSSTADMSPPTT